MKKIIVIFFLINLSFKIAIAKKFEDCEFARELNAKHEVPRDDIYKHLCITATVHITHVTSLSGFAGIYKIGTQWWCGQDQPGGSCNVKCSDLVDDDIADDVACANKILQSHGLGGWGSTERECKDRYQVEVDKCLAEEDAEEELLADLVVFSKPAENTDESIVVSSVATPIASTTLSSSTTSTTIPTTQVSTELIRRTTTNYKTTTVAPWTWARPRPTRVASYTTTQSTTTTEFRKFEAGLKEEQKSQESHVIRNTFLIIFTVMVFAAIGFAIFRYRGLIRHANSSQREYVNSLAL